MRRLLNLIGFLIKLLILPLILFTFSEYFTTPDITPFSSISSTLFIIFGLTGIIISEVLILRFGDGQIHFARKVSRLVDVGYYARTRHPYFWFFSVFQYGNLLYYTGYKWQTLLLSMGLSLLFLLYLRFVQEYFLIRSLGDQYRDYRIVTPLCYWKFKIPENRRVGFRPQLVWAFGMLVLRVWYKIKIEGTEHIPHERPFLVVANHESYLDPFLFGIFIPYEIKFVTTADVFTTPLMRFLLRGTGSFPMRRHRQDLKSIRTMIRMVNKGQIVGIFPEGGRSIDGSPLPILKETLKLIQKCRVPILPVHLDGAYEIWPRWAPNRRRGKVTASFKPMIQLEDQADLATLESRIQEAIFAAPKVFRAVHSTSMAKGLDNLFWACYSCKEHNSIRTISSDQIQCEHCQLQWQITNDYHMIETGTHKRISSIDWIQRINSHMLEHRLSLDERVMGSSDETGYISSRVVRYIPEDGTQLDSNLNLVLTDQRMVLVQNESVLYSWDLTSITIFTMDYFNAVSIGVGGVRHKFTLPDHEITLKWQTYFDVLKGQSVTSATSSKA